MIKIEHHPTHRQLAVFGLLWLVFFGILGTMSWWKMGISLRAVALWTVGAAIPAVGMLWSESLRIVYLGAAYATYPIGIVLSYLILAVMYYFVFTPIGLILRLRGHDSMQRRFDRNAETYWMPHEQEETPERYFQQY